jgi:glycosyltransferase involved in cell wall biosynthesis
MKILFLAHRYPWPADDGTRQRVYHLLEALTERHRVTLLTVLFWDQPNPADCESFPLRHQCERVILQNGRLAPCPNRSSWWVRYASRIGRLLTGHMPNLLRAWDDAGLVETLRGLKTSESFDLVWVERWFLAEPARRAGFRRIVVDIDDLESVRLGRVLAQAGWYRSKPFDYVDLVKLYVYERSLVRRFWRLVVCKEADRSFFAGTRQKVFVVPNGAAVLPETLPEQEQVGRLLFVGNMGYDPNVAAVKDFHGRIFPQIRQRFPSSSFHIVGKEPGPAVLALQDGTTCVVHGGVPDLTPFYAAASVVVVPITLGSGTRLKVLEALMLGKAVVATSIAIEGLDLRPGLDLEIADDPGPFADACVRLLSDGAARRQLGRMGRARVLERYQWKAICPSVARTLAEGKMDFEGEMPCPSGTLNGGVAGFP